MIQNIIYIEHISIRIIFIEVIYFGATLELEAGAHCLLSINEMIISPIRVLQYQISHFQIYDD